METDRVLIDTSILIRHFRSKEPHRSVFRKAIRRYDLCLSAITAYEIEFGAVRAGRLSDLAVILPYVEVLPIALEVAIKASELHSTLISRNMALSPLASPSPFRDSKRYRVNTPCPDSSSS